jgi:hypothetical protein
MAPIYMRVHPTGEQVWGSIPFYVPMEGTSGGGQVTDLFASNPLPWLPTKSIRPGDAWSSRFQNGHIDMDKLFDSTSVVRTYPARGEFLGVEWEMGHPCAKIKNSIDAAVNSEESKKLAKSGAGFSADEKISESETIWFALDSKKVLKVLREITLETKGTNSSLGFGSPFSGAGGSGGAGAARRPGMAMGGGPGGGGAGKAGSDVMMPPGQLLLQGRKGGGARGGPPPGGFGPGGIPGGFPGAPGGMGRPGAATPGGRAGSGAPPVEQQSFVKIHIQQTFTLEG